MGDRRMHEEAEELSRSYAAMMQGQSEGGDIDPGQAGEQEEKTVAPPAPMRILEALLFVGGPPLTAQRAGEILRGLGHDQFAEIIGELNRLYRRQSRPYCLEAKGEGYVLTLRPKYRSVREKVYGGQREARLSTAAID